MWQVKSLDLTTFNHDFWWYETPPKSLSWSLGIIVRQVLVVLNPCSLLLLSFFNDNCRCLIQMAWKNSRWCYSPLGCNYLNPLWRPFFQKKHMQKRYVPMPDFAEDVSELPVWDPRFSSLFFPAADHKLGPGWMDVGAYSWCRWWYTRVSACHLKLFVKLSLVSFHLWNL